MTKDQHHDDREALEAEAFTEEDAGDPAAVFDALRATVDDLTRSHLLTEWSCLA